MEKWADKERARRQISRDRQRETQHDEMVRLTELLHACRNQALREAQALIEQIEDVKEANRA